MEMMKSSLMHGENNTMVMSFAIIVIYSLLNFKMLLDYFIIIS